MIVDSTEDRGVKVFRARSVLASSNNRSPTCYLTDSCRALKGHQQTRSKLSLMSLLFTQKLFLNKIPQHRVSKAFNQMTKLELMELLAEL